MADFDAAANALLCALPMPAAIFVPLMTAGGAADDLRIVAVNPEAAAISGVPADRLIGGTLRAFIPAPRCDVVIRDFTRVCQTGKTLRYAASSPWKPDVAVEVRVGPYGDGCVACFHHLDATAMPMDTEVELRSRIALATRAARIGVWEYWPLTDRVIWNDTTREIYGMTGRPLTGRMDDFRNLVAPEMRHELDSANRRHAEEPTNARDWRLVLPNGEERWIHSHSQVHSRDEHGRVERVIGVTMDITEQRRLQQRLEDARAEAEQAVAAKSRFLATMSHEIRTPLNGVIGMSELLERRIEDPEKRRMLGVIREAGGLVLTIINDVLDHARIEAGRLQVESIPFRPADVARNVVAAHQRAAEAAGVPLRLTLGEGVAAPRLGDPHRFAQVLHNLVGNAQKFTAEGAIDVSLDLVADGPAQEGAAQDAGGRFAMAGDGWAGGDGAGDHAPADRPGDAGRRPDARAGDSPLAAGRDVLRLTVRDTGIGMTADQIARAFDVFTQADGSTTRRYGGSGLGLAIVRGLARAMGGDVALTGSPGKGVSVALTLPLPRAAADDADADADATAPPGRSLAGLRVLGVDDNPINQMVAEQMLQALGAQVVLASSGAEAVAMRGDADHDLILMDISMPDMDGAEALRRIRALEAARGLPAVPAIACTANVLPEQVSSYLAMGFDAHLAKPLRFETLAEVLTRTASRQHA